MENSLISKLKEYVQKVNADLPTKNTVEIMCGGNCYISGCEKIKVYSSDHIEMKCKGATFCFDGKGFLIENLINGQIVLKGRIDGVNISYDK